MAEIDETGEILLVRHAESEWNASGRWQGHADPPLSKTGRSQAGALAERLVQQLQGEPVDVLFSSDLQRAVETAEAIGKALGLTVQVDDRLRELDVGTWSGLVRAEIDERDPELLARFEAGEPGARPGGGETRAEIRLRAHDALESLIRAHPGQRVMLVSHLGFIRALLPGVEPGNAELIRMSAREALRRRALADRATSGGPL